MKVGILTHHWLPNFGANLQAYCTVRALKDLGCEPVVIDYRLEAIRGFYSQRVDSRQLKEHEKFVQNHLPLSPEVHTSEQVVCFAKDAGLEAVVSGSDAVLRLDRSRPSRPDLQFPNPFWLDWAGQAGISRSGFLAASSMGSNYLELRRGLRNSIVETVSSLRHCTVRDSWTRAMLRVCGIAAEKIFWCPDPVSYLSALDLESLLPSIEVPDRPFVLVSLYPQTASKEWAVQLRKEVNARGFLALGFPHPDYPASGQFDQVVDLPLDPLAWLAWLRACHGYIGVRFHPIMLSLVFNKPFVALDHYDLGVPFRNKILSRLGRVIAPLSRKVSKTYDLCHRADLEKYVLPARRLKSFSPAKVADLLVEQQSGEGGKESCRNWHLEFKKQLSSIVESSRN